MSAALTSVRAEPVDAAPLPHRTSDGRLVLSEVAMILAVVGLWAFAYLFVLSGFEHGHAQARLYGELRTDLALGEAPTGAPIAPGRPVALVGIARTGLANEVVVEGTTSTLLREGPGHVSGTVLPGQVGVSVLMGRSLSFGAPFGGAADLRAGDQVVVRTVQGRFDYRVVDVRRDGDPIPALASGGSRLVLVTTAGGGPLGGGLSRSGVVYVDADLSGTPVAAGAVGTTDPAGAALARDLSGPTFAYVALGLQLVLVAIGWVVWARARWSPYAAWATGLPVLLAALWVASSAASRLLPNLL
jgi:sortase A